MKTVLTNVKQKLEQTTIGVKNTLLGYLDFVLSNTIIIFISEYSFYIKHSQTIERAFII